MKKYQVSENFGKDFHAGSKAKDDAMAVLDKLGFERLYIRHSGSGSGFLKKLERQFRSLISWSTLKYKVDSQSILIRQNPFHNRQLGRRSALEYLKRKKNVYMISLVHDVEMIRWEHDTDPFKNEFDEMIEFADKLIIHNQKMKEWFLKYGVSEEKLVILEIFDYLLPSQPEKVIFFSRNIYIAGNLDQEKSPYVHMLSEVSDVQFQLMGVNYKPESQPNNVNYLGAFAPEDVPAQLTNGFGLVWDGESIDTCSGPTGNYLRYNNPHKLSLYLASGIPVIVWKESAEAELVDKLGLGITVNSLHELDTVLTNLSVEDYQEMVMRVKDFAPKLQTGYFLEKAVAEALEGK